MLTCVRMRIVRGKCKYNILGGGNAGDPELSPGIGSILEVQH